MAARPPVIRIAVLVITDGRRDCIQRMLASFESKVACDLITERWMFDDSGDKAHRDWLQQLAPSFVQLSHPQRQGFGGAINAAWSTLATESMATHVLHLEDDFTFNRRPRLGAMCRTLDDNLHVAQMALRRQPWNATELAAGGVVETNPDAYTERTSWFGDWLEHREFWTTNPAVFRRDICDHGWPTVAHSEGVFTARLRALGYTFGYWGARDSGEAVHHIGDQRAGSGY
jgi:hypothetical protein